MLALAASLPFVSSLVYFILLAGSSAATVVYSATKVFTLVAPVTFRKRLSENLKDAFIINRFDILLGAVSGVIVCAVIWLIMSSSLSVELQSYSGNIAAKIDEFGIRDNYLLFAIFISVFHSLIEEYYWRWFVYGMMRVKFSLPVAHVLAALAFTSHHVVVLSQYFQTGLTILFSLCVFAGGILFSWLYQRSGSLLGAWISHMLVDFGIMWAGYQLVYRVA